MKVSRLIEELKKCNGDDMVIIGNGDNDLVFEASSVSDGKYHENDSRFIFNENIVDYPEDYESFDFSGFENAVLILS